MALQRRIESRGDRRLSTVPIYGLLYGLLLIAMCACESAGPTPATDVTNELRELREKTAQTRNDVDELQTDLQLLSDKVEQLQTWSFAHEWHHMPPYRSVVLDLAASEEFFRLDTGVGSFAISVKDVRPHADGAATHRRPRARQHHRW